MNGLLKRTAALFVALIMVLSMLPATAFAAAEYAYIDASGAVKTASSATEITSATTQWTDGWYYVGSDVTVDNRIAVSGNVSLILGDGATLTAMRGIGVNTGNSLTIYGQTGGTGKLVVPDNIEICYAGIGGDEGKGTGNIVINGGILDVHGGRYAATIGGSELGKGGSVTINGGNITAIGHVNVGCGIGAGLGGTLDKVSINGGTVNAIATGGGAGIGAVGGNETNKYAIGCTYEIVINGGDVTAIGVYGAGIGGGSGGSGSCSITINGGTVNATSQIWGAGIGGGYGTNIDVVVAITGGVVSASGYSAFDIGQGMSPTVSKDTASVSISGGTVNAGSVSGIVRTVVTVGGASEGQKVDAISLSDGVYDLTGMVIQDTNKIYLWLNEGVTVTAVTVGGISYPYIYENMFCSHPRYHNATCIWMGECAVCGTAAKDPGNHASQDYTYTVNVNDATKHNVLHACCGSLVRTEAHTYENGVCKACGVFCNHPTVSGGACTVCGGSFYMYVRRWYDEASNTVKAENISFVPTNFVSSSDVSQTWESGWYTVRGDVNIKCDADYSVTISGDVHLVLLDGSTLTLQRQIRVNEGSSLTIYGQAADTGTLIVSSDKTGFAAIGSQDKLVNGDIVIHGGTVKATSTSYGAGIGAGDEASCGVVTIYGGNVEAKSHSGAGIGSGGNATSNVVPNNGTISIHGGTVTAVSTSTSSYSGAGIGGGLNIESGNILITGGTVMAQSMGVGAGIGGGYYGNGETITITGGTVTAIGGSGANNSRGGAGIGGGAGGNGGTTVITGGNVYATGGARADAIGGSYYGDGSSGTITDGSGNTLSLTTIVLGGLDAQTGVSKVTVVGNYGLQGVQTLNPNKLYFYLPADVIPGTVTADSIEYGAECRKTDAQIALYPKHSWRGTGICSNTVACVNCGAPGKADTTHDTSLAYSNGFCPNGCYEPARLVNGIWQISNAGNFYWFANQIRNGGIVTFHAMLTADIVFPDDIAWIPINVQEVAGGYSTFDGNGHSIDIKSQTGGLFERFNYGTVKNLTLLGSINAEGGNVAAVIGSAYRTRIQNVLSYVHVSNPTGNAGGLVGYYGGKHSDGLESKISNCAVYADITGNNAGGLVAEGWNGTQYFDITNCTYVGNVTGTNAGAIVGYQNTDTNTCTFTNIYWCETDGLEFYGKRDTANQVYSNTKAKTLDQFASGEVAYLLGESWGQVIGSQEYPVPNGQPVYLVLICGKETYSNTNESFEGHVYDSEGFCNKTEGEIHYQPATDENGDGVWEIGNAGQLYWFAELVNGGDYDANAVLNTDIDLKGRTWNTICSTDLFYQSTTYTEAVYTGTFNGAGHVISNYVVKGISGTKCSVALFGTAYGATIKDLGVNGMTFELNGATDVRAAAIVGQMLEGTLVKNCFVINAVLTPNQYIVGGIAACNYGGTIDSCYTYNVTASGNERCGNLVSDTRGDINETDRPGTVVNCYTDAARIAGTQSGGKISGCQEGISKERFTAGEVAYLLGEAWGQTVGEGLPVIGGARVYYGYLSCAEDAVKVYTNDSTASTTKPGHTFDENGKCVCNAQAVAQVGETYYATVQTAADNASGSYVKLLGDSTESVTVQGDLYLDLNGYDLQSLAISGTLYGMDSTTDDYDCADGFGTIGQLEGAYEPQFKTNITGSIKRYVAITEDGKLSFHRIYAAVTHKTLRPSKVGLGYKAGFYGDQLVKKYVTSFGLHVWVDKNNVKTASLKGEDFVSGTVKSLRIDHVLSGKDTDAAAAQTVINADAFMTLTVNGQVIEIETGPVSGTLKQLLEAVNLKTADYTDAQLSALKTVVSTYRQALTEAGCQIDNLLN